MAVNVMTADGLIGTSLIATSRLIVPPHLAVIGPYLYWSHASESGAARLVSGKRAFDEFMKLRDRAGILTFARKYGVLRLCEHGLPATHNPGSLPANLGGSIYAGCEILRLGAVQRQLSGADFRERTTPWRSFARQARAMLALAVDLHTGRSGKAAYWRILRRSWPRLAWATLQSGSTVEQEWSALTLYVNDWLALGGVRPIMLMDAAGCSPKLRLQVSLFGILAVQLFLAIARASTYAWCDGCGGLYEPAERRPKSGQRHFCPGCRGSSIPARLRKENQRTKQRSGKTAGGTHGQSSPSAGTVAT